MEMDLKWYDAIENGFLIPPDPLSNFEIQKYYQNKLRFMFRFVFILEIIYPK